MKSSKNEIVKKKFDYLPTISVSESSKNYFDNSQFLTIFPTILYFDDFVYKESSNS